jgi:hypothetical protein
MLLCPLHTHTSPKRTSSRVTDDEPSFTVTVCAVSPPTRAFVMGSARALQLRWLWPRYLVVVIVEVVLEGRQQW